MLLGFVIMIGVFELEFEFAEGSFERLVTLLEEDLKHGEMMPNLAHLLGLLKHCDSVGTTLHINF